MQRWLAAIGHRLPARLAYGLRSLWTVFLFALDAAIIAYCLGAITKALALCFFAGWNLF
jgi:hypothetical protein